MEKKKDNNKTSIIVACIIGIAIIGVAIIVSKNSMERLKYNEQQEELRQNKLQTCISQAKTIRDDLWNANCTKQKNGSCTIQNGTGTIEWIEERYQTELNNCYKLYN